MPRNRRARFFLSLNREWIDKQGDFFVESPINFLTAIIWFLSRYEGGRYCTLPHVIEPMLTPYEQLFPVLNKEPEIEVLITPFISGGLVQKIYHLGLLLRITER